MGPRRRATGDDTGRDGTGDTLEDDLPGNVEWQEGETESREMSSQDLPERDRKFTEEEEEEEDNEGESGGA